MEGKDFKAWLMANGKTRNTAIVYLASVNSVSKHFGRDVLQIADVNELEGVFREYGRGGSHASVGTHSWRSGLRQLIEYRVFLQGGEGGSARDVSVVTLVSALNQILFGPPGVGKTYATIDKALDIIAPGFLRKNSNDRVALKEHFDALVSSGRVRFVTFHQSFSYEDFVEGLVATTEKGQLSYEVRAGVFKTLCEQATVASLPDSDMLEDALQQLKRIVSTEDPRGGLRLVADQSFQLCSFGDDYLARFHDDSVEHVVRVVDLRQLYQRDLKPFAIEYGRGVAAQEVLMHFLQDKFDKTLVVSGGNYSTVIERAPASDIQVRFDRSTGKIFVSRSDIRQWLSERGKSPREFAVESVRQQLMMEEPTRIMMGRGTELVSAQKHCWVFRFDDPELYEKVFGVAIVGNSRSSYVSVLQMVLDYMIEHCGLQAVDELDAEPEYLPHVLIIDEINRGNVSRIFGELITLIEPSKRAGAEEELSVVLPYSRERFSVPGNLYLIGTMNSADRSLAGLDVALRRRFSFCEMPPRPDLLDGVLVEGVDIGRLLRVMNQRIEVLLDRDHCLGHAWFMVLQEDPTLEQLAQVFRNQVLPLLQEYFFEDWQRIQWVLNDHRKPAALRFVDQPALDMQALFGSGVPVAAHSLPWQINPAAFGNPAAYAGIIEVPGA